MRSIYPSNPQRYRRSLVRGGTNGIMHKPSAKPITLPVNVDQLNEWLFAELETEEQTDGTVSDLSVPRNKLVVRVVIVPKLDGSYQTRGKVQRCFRSLARPGHNAGMRAYDFKLALTRVIEPTGGPGAELATLEDAARFVGLMRPWRQARPHWDYAAELLLKAAGTKAEENIEAATTQMERTLRVEGRL